MSDKVTRDVLNNFLDAFNRHDLDAIMGYFADDCVFYLPGVRSRAATGSWAKRRSGPGSPSASRASPMCTTATAGTGWATTVSVTASASGCPSGR
ncbi:nuclear transport factor 2 family protein [Cryobacterium sp. TMT2-15-1]|uniref:nuclear transport factor 2 family protein n=1 Tax=Cryobacterium sp. TMT2-15-1 TaxID=1259246 RepID=UPI0018E0B68E